MEVKRRVHREVSVACLQDKLVQMEINYSTQKELQATLQELTDLKYQLEEFQSENRTQGCARRRRGRSQLESTSLIYRRWTVTGWG